MAVNCYCRIVQTIGEHVIAQDTLACRNEGVGVEEAAGNGGIIAGLEIVELGFLVVDIAPVGEGIGPRRLRIYGKQMITDIQ